MSETKEVNINVGFELDRKTWFVLAAAAALLVGGILASVAIGISWGSYDTTISGFGDAQTGTSHYKAFSMADDEGAQSVEYTHKDLDDADGIGMLRAAGPLLMTGMIVSFVTAVVLLVTAFVKVPVVRMVAAPLAVVGAILAIVGVILLPVGVEEFHGQFEGEQGNGFGSIMIGGVSWGAGLIVGVLGAFLILVGGVAAILSLDFSKFTITTRGEVDLD